MSLSFLLGKPVAGIDEELDNLFNRPVGTQHFQVFKLATPGSSKTKGDKKRKLDVEEKTSVGSASKRVKSSEKPSKPSKPTSAAQESPEDDTHAKPTRTQKKSTKKGKGKAKAAEVDSDDEKDEEKLETAYLKNQADSKPEAGQDKEGSDSDGEEDGDVTNLVHESVEKSTKKRAPKVKKYVPQEETAELRNQRTIFVGNLPLEVASKKPLNKQFQRHILSFLPTAKIESVRFRSIPFQAPTAKLPTDDDGAAAKSKVATKPVPKKELRPHEKERANVWKSKLDEKDEEGMKKDEKRFLNSGQKKRIAFINQEFHSTADTVNAYVVFAHPPSLEGRPANLPPPPPTMDPYQAAQLAAEKCDGTHFMERMLRVDLVAKGQGENTDSKTDLAMKHAAANFGTDPRLSVFVGNLEFASKEEDLRVFFEGVISAERGPPPAVSQDKNDDEVAEGTEVVSDKPAAWVTRVRIVRDKDTQLGKGFAYVQFADRECVDELLALEEQKLKFAKRKLRVQRCKSLPGGKTVTTSQKKEFAASVAVVVPKGDPALGEKLAGLSKDERKQVKSSDADRVARRLAKKKARMNMKPGVGKKATGKDRKRVRSH